MKEYYLAFKRSFKSIIIGIIGGFIGTLINLPLPWLLGALLLNLLVSFSSYKVTFDKNFLTRALNYWSYPCRIFQYNFII